MKCPIHKNSKLESAVFYNTEVDFCPIGLGIWFDKEELNIAKDTKKDNLDWLDVDLWEDKTKFEISKEEKLCPHCDVPLYQVTYHDSDIVVDICNVCQGIWLDRGEFKKIINYLQDKASQELLENYTEVLMEETSEVFTGPESLEDELSDVGTVMGLLKHKLAVKFPMLTDIINSLP